MIISVAGPKGGVGKTVFVANLAVILGQSEYRVLAIDLDLGAANLHVMFNAMQTEVNLFSFLGKSVKSLEDIVIRTGYQNVFLISGAGHVPGLANIFYQTKMKLISHIKKLDYDIVILDLGAGTAYNILDFYSIGDRKIVITSPEITSVMNSYSFLKSYIFRQMERYLRKNRRFDTLSTLTELKNPENSLGLKTVPQILAYLKKEDETLGNDFESIVNRSAFTVIFNRAKKDEGNQVARAFSSLLNQYLGVSEYHFYVLPEDEKLPLSVAIRKPLVDMFPESPFVLDVKRFSEIL
ncbi:MAG: hypothetical protein DRG59_01845 [Deltaproteobacteria bacterium]|nr:MAG: hypothetical protein DRG59_01845 [Deltaproteobacteria bacterium]